MQSAVGDSNPEVLGQRGSNGQVMQKVCWAEKVCWGREAVMGKWCRRCAGQRRFAGVERQ